MPAPNSVPEFTLAETCIGQAQISAANTARDGTGTIVDVVTAGLEGTEITLIRVVAQGATTVGVVRIFIYDGATYRLYKELLVTAITPSTSVEVFSIEFVPSKPLKLSSGKKLAASTHIAETFGVFAHGGNY